MAAKGATRTSTTAKVKAAPASSSGAVQSRTSLSRRFGSYWAHHQTALLESLSRLLKTPLQTLMTSLVVAVALALPTLLLVALENVTSLGERWDTDPEISVFLNPRARQAAIEELESEIKRYESVKSTRYLSQNDALAEFETHSGLGGVLTALDENPLSPLIVVTLVSGQAQGVESLSAKLREHALVQDVSFDLDWVKRLQAIMALGKKVVLALATLLGVGVVLAIGNTIRLTIENRRDEILVVKLVGGTNGFVRRPFLYTGGWYGLFGGVLACVIVGVGLLVLAPAVSQISSLYQSEFSLDGLGLLSILSVVTGGVLLGWIGAWLAVSRHLSKIEPS